MFGLLGRAAGAVARMPARGVGAVAGRVVGGGSGGSGGGGGVSGLVQRMRGNAPITSPMQPMSGAVPSTPLTGGPIVDRTATGGGDPTETRTFNQDPSLNRTMDGGGDRGPLGQMRRATGRISRRATRSR